MSIERVSLELPANTAPEEAEKKAIAQLRKHRIREWSALSLQTILTTDTPGISRYSFTYWVEDEALE
ncbi:hypothetical protein [Rhodococcus jostii]|uniref:Uncharacterized protein n=1 Tax=Rhodococcus jostii TaxID=132919 RepID=A0A1H4IKJ4_RHOJO|nr:hypothetical protein [Rhodococcus jostii]SEB34609.1 hypothetical protein SAMN04490220_0166 [Rhodococcus jostii]